MTWDDFALAFFSLDILRLLVDCPPTQALTPATAADKALDVRDTVAATRRNLVKPASVTT